MPRNLPNPLLEAKNAFESTAPWLLLLDVVIPLAEPLTLFIVNNNENISFGTPPQEYTAYPFSISLPTQTKDGEIPKTNLIVYDVDKTLRRYIDDLNGGYGTTVTLRLVHTDSLASQADYADLTLYFDLLEAIIDGSSISISLGAPNMMRQSFPPGRYIANHCLWVPHYGGVECKLPLTSGDIYNRTEFPLCPGTKAACAERNNTRNYGGHPGLSDSSLRIA
jgi:phage-related protein